MKHAHHVCVRHRPETRHIDVCPHFCDALWGNKRQQGATRKKEKESMRVKSENQKLCCSSVFIKLIVCVGEVCRLAFN